MVVRILGGIVAIVAIIVVLLFLVNKFKILSTENIIQGFQDAIKSNFDLARESILTLEEQTAELIVTTIVNPLQDVFCIECERPATPEELSDSFSDFIGGAVVFDESTIVNPDTGVIEADSPPSGDFLQSVESQIILREVEFERIELQKVLDQLTPEEQFALLNPEPTRGELRFGSGPGG